MALTPSINEIAFTCLNSVRGKTVVTEVISVTQIKFLVKVVRAQLLKQDANKGYTADSYIIQDLGCVPVEMADVAECCQVTHGCTILRTVNPIPSTIELHHTQLFTRIGPVDRTQTPFDIIPYERVPYEGDNKFHKNIIKAFTQNNKGYVYFLVPRAKSKMIKYVNIQGVFEDPEQVAEFTTCEGTACYTDDTAFPIKQWMVDPLCQIVIAKYLRLASQVPFDLSNNAKPDITTQAEGS